MLLENTGSVERTVMFNLYLCALLCQFHVRWSLEMRFCVVQLEKLARTQPVVAFSTLEFHSFLCSWQNTHVTKFSYNAQTIACCLVASLFSWLMDGAFLPCHAIKTTSGKGSLLVWGGCVCCNPLTTPVNLRTTGIEG